MLGFRMLRLKGVIKLKKYIIYLLIISNLLFVGCNTNLNENYKEHDYLNITNYEKQSVDLINSIRKQNNLNLLELSEEAQKLAYLKTKDMIDKNYFEHKSIDNLYINDLADENNIQYDYICENLYRSNLNNVNINTIVEKFMNSESHKKNILDKNIQFVGIYIIKYKDIIFCTQVFIKK